MKQSDQVSPSASERHDNDVQQAENASSSRDERRGSQQLLQSAEVPDRYSLQIARNAGQSSSHYPHPGAEQLGSARQYDEVAFKERGGIEGSQDHVGSTATRQEKNPSRPFKNDGRYPTSFPLAELPSVSGSRSGIQENRTGGITSAPRRHSEVQQNPSLHSSSTTTVNVSMPRRRTSRSDQAQPIGFVVGPESARSQGSSSIATTPGYGLVSLSTVAEHQPNLSSEITSSNVEAMPHSEARKDTPALAETSLDGFSRVREGRRYSLVVVQHPERARMCGYGDKDRRPLSPSLIVKLVITDEASGKEISPWDVNTSLFFLASDLCDPEELMRAPRNLLVNNQVASIPASMLPSSSSRGYADQTTRLTSSTSQAVAGGSLNLPSLSNLQVSDRSRGETGTFGPSGLSREEHRSSNSGPPPPPSSSSSISNFATAFQQQQQPLTTVTTEHYARNLVGAAVTSANVLRDETDQYCIFFVLQDLSVRAEGTYRIRLLFTDLAQQDGRTAEGASEALAEVYTDPFSVYTPRRFPGMLEPTALSKKLASQGIKIAVRSDKKKRRRESNIVNQEGSSSHLGVGSVGGASRGTLEVDELEDDEDDD